MGVVWNENKKNKSMLRVSLKKDTYFEIEKKTHIFFIQLGFILNLVFDLGKRIFLIDIELYKNYMYWGLWVTPLAVPRANVGVPFSF